jgi:protein involved in polysaccharide export with SLBB domain
MRRQQLFAALAVFLCALAGCSTTSLGRITGYSSAHKLSETARALRSQATEPAALPRELDKRPAPPMPVEPGDVVLVLPTDLDSTVRLPGDQPVLPDGTITLGHYGRVVVAGKTLDEIEALVHHQIEAKTKENVGVSARLVSRQSKVYYVLGEVNAPGAFAFNGRETVLDAIVAAGGLTDRASRQSITMSRPTAPDSCRIVLPICYNEIVQIGDTSTNYQIAAGDRIYVPAKTLQEDFCRKKQTCPPCDRPQSACFGGGCGQTGDAMLQAPVAVH